MLKLMFGELSTLLLDGQKVLPHVLLTHGFQFKYPTIDQALSDLASTQT
jgi:NAD dependent epimerase/dehydratase family enzyme